MEQKYNNTDIQITLKPWTARTIDLAYAVSTGSLLNLQCLLYKYVTNVKAMKVFKPLDVFEHDEYVSNLKNERKSKHFHEVHDIALLKYLEGESLPDKRFESLVRNDVIGVLDGLLLLVGLRRDSNSYEVIANVIDDIPGGEGPVSSTPKENIERYCSYYAERVDLINVPIFEPGISRIDGLSMRWFYNYSKYAADRAQPFWDVMVVRADDDGKQKGMKYPTDRSERLADAIKQDIHGRLLSAIEYATNWETGEHPEKMSIAYCIEWGNTKNRDLVWREYALQEQLINPAILNKNYIPPISAPGGGSRDSVAHSTIQKYWQQFRSIEGVHASPKEFFNYLRKTTLAGIENVPGSSVEIKIEGKVVGWDSFRHWKVFK